MISHKKLILTLIPLLFSATFLLSMREAETDNGEQLARQYCGSCHLMPMPQRLPRVVWQLNVLPVMAAYLGIRYLDHDPYRNLKPDEVALLKQEHIFPDKPVIDNTTWQKIVAYYVDNAPNQSPLDSTRQYRSQVMPQRLFSTKLIPLGKTPGSLVTALAYDTLRRELWVAEPDKLYRWNATQGLTHNYSLPGTVVDVSFALASRVFTQIGTLLPSELSKGDLFSFTGDSLKTLASGLHRPVCTVIADVNNDGKEELITANYGHRTGSLSLYVAGADGRYVETVLLNEPGAVKCYVQDMNGDGRKDIIALFAQNDEAVYIFYQTANLQFRAEKVLQFEPEYGTSDFVLVDYNKDGINDLAVVHGDNADYSYCLKPFHGLRVFLGAATGHYTEAFFYPLYGATRVQADDFDQDGDIDFAVSCFFPELTYLAQESFVFLENINSARFQFSAYTLPLPVPAKSLTLEKADIDHDGDMDLVLGQFGYSPVSVPPALKKQWDVVPYKLVVLLNEHKP